MAGVSLSCSCMQLPEISLRQEMALPYNPVGDLELFSLHRIKHRIGSLGVHPRTRGKLIQRLLEENRDYREKTQSRKLCVTMGGVESAFDDTIDYLMDKARLGLETVEDRFRREVSRKILEEAVNRQDRKIRNWFNENYENLSYDQNSKIPFPVVRLMRKRFSAWALGELGFSSESIFPLIDDAARDVGVNPDLYDSYETLWEDLRDYGPGKKRED